MKSYISLLSVLLLGMNSYAQKFVPNELVIQSYEPIESLLLDPQSMISAYDIEPIFKAENIYKLTFSDQVNLDKEKTNWSAIKGIKHVMKNFIAESRNRPNDQFFSEQVGFEIMNVESAWNLTTGGFTRNGQEIVVAVIDDGFDLNHDDFAGNIWNNAFEIPNDNIDNDNNGYIDDIQGIRAGTPSDNHPSSNHGNSVVGTIGAKGDNDIGVSGVNWDIKIMTISSNGTVAQILESYSYILDQRRRYNSSNGQEGSFVVATNASFGIDNAFAVDYPIWCEMYDLLGSEGILNVGATSNDPIDVDTDGDMPTTCPSQYLIAVTTTDGNNILDAGYGSTHIDIVAPGDLGYTTSINNNYREFTGTSSATPMVAGAIGLIYSLDSDLINSRCSPTILASTIKEIILNTVTLTNTFSTNTVSGGIIDIDAACNALLKLNASSGNDDSSLSICDFSTGPLTERLIATVSNPDIEDYEIVIHSTSGQVVRFYERDELDCYKINVAGLSTGFYFFSIISENSKTVRKFFKL